MPASKPSLSNKTQVQLVELLEGRRPWLVLHARAEFVLTVLGREAVDHVLTDPPYDERTHAGAVTSKGGGKRGARVEMGFDPLRDLRHVQQQLHVAKRWVLDFCPVGMLGDYARAAGPQGYIRDGAWDRPDGTPQRSGDRPAQGFEGIAIMHRPGRKSWNGGGKRAVWTCGVERDERVHPAQKPVKLLIQILLDFTEPGDLVLDPYAGVASVGVAALRTGRRYLGVEKDPRWLVRARARCRAAAAMSTVADAEAGQLPLLAGV